MSLSRIRKPTLIVLSLLLALGLLFAMPAPTPVYADTSVGGPIISNTTWTKAQSPYLVVANIEVWQGVTLTIEPGVVVKVQPGKLIQVGGTLIARGTANQNITFTSAKSNPAKGDWGNIRFTSTAVPTAMDTAGNYVSGSVLQYCIVEYGGASSTAAIDARSLLIDHCSVRANASPGIYDVGTVIAPSRITNSSISGNTGSYAIYGGGIYAEYSTISGNEVSYNSNPKCPLQYNYGGGIAAINSSIDHNIVFGNTCYCWGKGGGIYGENSTIYGNAIYGNKAYGEGGGIYASGGTVSDNTVTGNSGGGIYASGATVSRNTVRYNQAAGSGGGIEGENATIIDNAVIGNSTGEGGFGGGIRVFGGIVRGNKVIGNLAGTGGGIEAFSSAVIDGNTIIGNWAGVQGSGIWADGCSVLANTIVANASSSLQAGGLAIDGRTYLPTPQVHYNNLYGNSNYDVVILFSGDVDGTNNYWGTVATVDILSHVYDWYDNTSRGRLLYIPYRQDPDPNAPVPPPMNLRGTFSGSSATLTWDPIPSTTTGYGYKIYYDNDYSEPPYSGTGLAQGNSPIDVGNMTSYTLSGLASGKYYFTVAAYDNQGHESWYSNQLVRLSKVYLPLVRR